MCMLLRSLYRENEHLWNQSSSKRGDTPYDSINQVEDELLSKLNGAEKELFKTFSEQYCCVLIW